MPSTTSSDWSFNLRSGAGACSGWDSSSGSDSDGGEGVQETQDKSSGSAAEITQELEESTPYKPNPFSIAKINAALRGNTSQPTEKALSKEPIGDVQKGLKFKGNILEQLKKQAAAKSLPSATSSGEPSIQGQSNPKLLLKKPGPGLLVDPQAGSSVPTSSNGLRTRPHFSSPKEPQIQLQPSAKAHIANHPAHYPASLQPHLPPQSNARRSLLNTTNVASQPSTTKTNLPPASLYRKFAPDAAHSDDPPVSAFSKTSHQPSLTHHRQSSVELSGNIYPKNFFSPPKPSFSNYGNAQPDSFSSPTRPSQGHSQIPATERPMYGATLNRAFEPSSSPAYIQHGKSTNLPTDEFQVTDDEDDQSHPPRHQGAYIAPRKRQRSPVLLESSKKRAKVALPNRSRRDAYDLPLGDPDESFSTLPSKERKRKGSSPQKPKRTQKFRIPTLTGQLPPGTRSGMSATSGCRVITFLPPPLPVKTSAGPGDTKNATTRRTQAYPSPKRSDYSPTTSSSPPRPDHGVPIHSVHQMRAAINEGDDADEGFAPLSPPPSDGVACALGLQDEGSVSNEAKIGFDVESVAGRYPRTKAARRERRRLADGVWDMLGLPSCGVVYCDMNAEGSKEEGESAEIAIVTWNGLMEDAC